MLNFNKSFFVGIAYLIIAFQSFGNSYAEPEANQWQGEWNFRGPNDARGVLSIRSCEPVKKTCEVHLDTFGYDNSLGARCSIGRTAGSSGRYQRNPQFVTLSGFKATVKPKDPYSSKECTFDLNLNFDQSPPVISVTMTGKDCAYWCNGDTAKTIPRSFALRSKENYLQYETYSKNYRCFDDDSKAIREWCTHEDIASLRREFKALLMRIHRNTIFQADKVYKNWSDSEYLIWEEQVIKDCDASSNVGQCILDVYKNKNAELTDKLNERFMDSKVMTSDVFAALYKSFDMKTMKTGRKTEVNSRFNNKPPQDEIVIFQKTVAPSFLPGYLINIRFVSDSDWGLYGNAFFSVLKYEGNQLKVITDEPIADTQDKDLHWDGNRAGTRLKFELENYKMNDSERAFGYRLKTWGGGTGGEAGSEKIRLFRVVSGGVKMIFDDTVSEHDTFAGSWFKGTISVTKTKHNGNYDWVMQVTSNKKKNRKSGVTYVWDNNKYVPKDHSKGK